jgi:predicted alpha/beta-hydrolase family hydrolase
MKVWFLFAPGSGAASTHPWMTAWATRLAAIGPVERFDYDYRHQGRKLPDRMPALLAAHRRALEAGLARHPERTCVLIGRSMGGRVGLHLAAEAPHYVAVALAYPFRAHSGLRVDALRAVRRPALVVQGTRDPFGGPDEIRAAVDDAPVTVVAVDGGDHGLLVPRRGPVSQEASDVMVLGSIRAFLERALMTDPGHAN